MDEVIDIDTDLTIKTNAKESISRLLSESNHPDPLLAIQYRGSGTSEENMKWQWQVCTINRGALSLFTTLRFQKDGFTFHSTYDDLDLLKDKLNEMIIDSVDNNLIINFKNK